MDGLERFSITVEGPAVRRMPRRPEPNPRRTRQRLRHTSFLAGQEKAEGWWRPVGRHLKGGMLAYVERLKRAGRLAGRVWGMLTGKCVEVYKTLLLDFLNWETGECYPTYEAIAERAGCCRQTVATSITTLESLGLLQRRRRYIQVDGEGVRGGKAVRQTSNGYRLLFPASMVSSMGARGVAVDHLTSEDWTADKEAAANDTDEMERAEREAAERAAKAAAAAKLDKAEARGRARGSASAARAEMDSDLPPAADRVARLDWHRARMAPHLVGLPPRGEIISHLPPDDPTARREWHKARLAPYLAAEAAAKISESS